MSGAESGAPSLEATDWSFGRGLRGYLWQAREPRAALLLQHGFCEYAERYVARYNALIPRLVERGISVYAFDLRGHGRSPGARAITDVRAAVDDHLAARRALRALSPPLFLFGHSLGGLVTAASVARDPAGVRGVVLSSPFLVADASSLRRWAVLWLGRLAPRSIVRRTSLEVLSRIPEEVRLAKSDPMFCKVRGVSALFASSSLAAMWEAWRRFPRWSTPVLVFHGTADRLTSVEGSKRFVDTIAATDKTLRLFEGGYHEILNDLDRDEALSLVLGWIEERIR